MFGVQTLRTMISEASDELGDFCATMLTDKGVIASAVEVFSNHPVFTGFGLFFGSRLTHKGLQHSPLGILERLLPVPPSSHGYIL